MITGAGRRVACRYAASVLMPGILTGFGLYFAETPFAEAAIGVAVLCALTILNAATVIQLRREGVCNGVGLAIFVGIVLLCLQVLVIAASVVVSIYVYLMNHGLEGVM